MRYSYTIQGNDVFYASGTLTVEHFGQLFSELARIIEAYEKQTIEQLRLTKLELI